MALPANVQTPLGLELQAKLNAADPALKDWTQPTKDDFVLFGALIVFFSHIELAMRRLIDVFEYKKVLPQEWRGKGTHLLMREFRSRRSISPTGS